MNNKKIYQELLSLLSQQITFLDDKPEETAQSTLNALWSYSAGFPVSATKAIEIKLPKLSKEQIELLQELIQLRISSTPLAYITRRQSFMNIEMLVDKRALIPRKETEILGEVALRLTKEISTQKKPAIVMDVCCGAGNIGLALATYNPYCKVYSTDISKEATDLAIENILFFGLQNRIKVKYGNLFSAFENKHYYNKADIIVCNPPYIQSSRVDKMAEEIANNEPSMAFDGGMLGISIIQQLLKEAPKFMAKKAKLAIEIGAGQGGFILKLFEKSTSFKTIESICDNRGTQRVIVAQLGQ